jgi:hypothetical protein
MGILGLILISCLIYGIIATGLWQYVLLLAVAALGIYLVYWIVSCLIGLILLLFYTIKNKCHPPIRKKKVK